MSLIKPTLPKSIIGKPNWLMIVDQTTQFKLSRFYASKSAMVESTCALLKQWKEEGHPVSHIRMDNGGENIALMNRCKSAEWQLTNIKFEMTARDTPQQNSLVEVGFATVSNRAKAMLSRASVPIEERYKVYIQALIMATRLDALVVITLQGKTLTRFEHFYGKLPPYLKHLHTWGEAGVVKLKTKTSPKMLNKGLTCMFVGYPANHSSDCYEMWDATKDSYHVSRDVVWLHRMYYKSSQSGQQGIEAGEGNGNEIEMPNDEPMEEPTNNLNPFIQVVQDQEDALLQEQEQMIEDAVVNQGFTAVTRSGRQVKKPARLIETINTAMSAITSVEKNYYEALQEMASAFVDLNQDLGNEEIVCVGAALGGGFGTTDELVQ
jgi:hypothetical protein